MMRWWWLAAAVVFAVPTRAAVVPSGGTPVAEAWADTTHVAAPRVTLDEIIADIGRRQRANRAALRSLAFTAVVTTVRSPAGAAIGVADSTGTWELEETALRYQQDQGRPDRVVTLWERKQAFVRGAPQAPKETLQARPRWQPRPNDMVTDLPFAEGGARLYRYELRSSKLVGSSLVHEVAFTPRDRFAALPSGTIWVDIADWAIRRVEARFEESVPYPWLLRAVPYYRLAQAPCGDVWFPVLESARVDMRDLPLVDAGGTYHIRVELRDIVINGEPCDGVVTAADAEPGAALFWTAIDDMWTAELPAPLQQPSSLAPARLDSLSREGARLLAALPERPPYRLRWRPLAPAFNRAQGPVPRLGLAVGRTGGGLRLDADLGAGLDDRRLEWGLGLKAPLGGGLALRAGAARATSAFAGDGRPGARSWSALLWGADPNHYYDRTAWEAGLRWQRSGDAPWLTAAWTLARELPLAMHQRWNLAGRALSPVGMLAADALDSRTVRVAGGLRRGSLTIAGGVARHALEARLPGGSGGSGGSRDVDAWHWSARWQQPDALGNRWTLRAGGRGVDGPAPAQQRVWLGDWQPAEVAAEAAPLGVGPLCGWPAGSLLGDRGAWASLELDLNVDPWRALGVPGLRDLRLRPLLFAEWAGAWGQAGEAWPGAAPAVGLRGEGAPPTGTRVDLGLGFTRRLDLPLVGAGSRLEVRAARAVGPESEGRDWRFVVGIGR